MGRFKAKAPVGTPPHGGLQHAYRPHRPFDPIPLREIDVSGSPRPGSSGHVRRSFFVRHDRCASAFLRPFAPRALPRFIATMDALTPARRLAPSFPDRSPCFTHTPFRTVPSPTTLRAPVVDFARYPSPRRASKAFFLRPSVGTSPSASRLVGRVWPNRVRLLRTGRSPSVASHPASRRRSYRRLQAGERILGGDFHPSERVRLQAH